MKNLELAQQIRSFNRLYTQTIGSLDENHEGLNITLGESRLLFTINTHNKPHVNQIAETLNFDLAYTSRLLGRLEDAGLVKRTISTKDRRQRVVVLTAKGARLLTRIEDRSNQRVLATFEHLDSAEIERLLNAMDTISALINKQETHDSTN